MTAPLARNIFMAVLALGVPAMTAVAHPSHEHLATLHSQIVAVEHDVRPRRMVFRDPRTKGHALLPGASIGGQHIGFGLP